ncbi:MAG TPA: PP0621 family protein [Methylotenera sp.]|nr:PP0621 family protein [Methylotenera sp.]
MWRLIFLGLMIWLVFYWVKRYIRSSKSSAADTQNQNETASNHTSEKVEDMVQCAHCAVHLPRSEAFLVDGKIYCSKNHIPKI